ASLVKASQAISGEIVLENLLNKLMKIVLENAGAQRGVLVLESEGSLLVAAEETMDQDQVLLSNVQVNQSAALSAAMVHYVARTHELLVLGNAAREGRFTEDPYVLDNSPKSVLCLPMIHKSQLSGILYLENNITTDAFTAKHVEALELLSGQIASSLDNARLYKHLEESELRYRQLYENIIDMVLLVDDQDTVLMANPCFYNTIGILDSPERQYSFTEWVHPDDLSQVKTDLVEKLRSGHEINDFQFRLQDTGSRILEVECNARCIIKEDELIGYQMVIRDITDRNRLQKDLITSLKNMQKAKSGTILGLAKLAEFRDEETGVHLERIQEYTRILARELATTSEYESYIDEEYIEDIYFSSILHDIGKVGVPDNILLKQGELTVEEFEVIKRHPVIGGEVLKGVDKEVGQQSFLSMANEIAFFHHEKWNGTGYPKGLKGEEIPLSARIVGLADVYDALTTKRVYKEAYSHEKAKRIIIEDRGKHFDPLVVDAFLATEDKFDLIRRELDY
ncbi:MAG: HD domain-containing protein, partial [Desulfohalobiaceae bacterium]|nr:HD domain-containing protein [Desulfohalobiaceae bacterium]